MFRTQIYVHISFLSITEEDLIHARHVSLYVTICETIWVYDYWYFPTPKTSSVLIVKTVRISVKDDLLRIDLWKKK